MIVYKISCIDSIYGINAYENDILLKQAEQITNSKDEIEKLINICNELEIELCHLDYIIEDYLTDFCV